MGIGTNKSCLVFDIETNSLDPMNGKVKWFGAFSFKNNQYYEIQDKEEIESLIKNHKVLIGFNCKEFDIPFLENDMNIDFKYKVIVDLLNVSKLRLPMMGLAPKNYKLKTIIEHLGLDKNIGTKGDIDYTIFQHDDWSNKQIEEIKKYLRQDVKITKELFEWFYEKFEPIRQYLSQKDKDNYNDVKSSTASLAYRVICNIAGLKPEFTDKGKERVKIAGGHHILPRTNKIKGHLVSVDFRSAYPHSIMMGNLLSPTKEKGWTGGDYYNINGNYKSDVMGEKEKALRSIFLERMKAKKEGDKIKSLAYKIIINSLYGTLGNTAFKHTYDPVAAGDTTAMTRTWLKKLGKTLEENGFVGVYGFTDSVTVLIPEHLTKKHLMIIVNKFVEDVKKSVPFPQDTFGLEVEKEMKFLWVIAKNCYLWVNMDDTIGYRSTLFNKNTPPVIMQLFNEYIAPKIVRELDVEFDEKELKDKLKEYLMKDLSKACQEYDVKDVSQYNNETSMQYNISKAYGPGKHLLIPNLKLIGIGKEKSNKRRVGIRYCTIQEFRDNNLKINDISLNRLMKYISDFYKKEKIDKSQTSLSHYGNTVL